MSVKYEIWNFQNMAQYLENNKQDIIDKGSKSTFKGFQYFGPYLLTKIDRYNRESYNLKDLSSLEIQKDFNENPIFYSRFIVGLKDEEVVGIIACQWIKDSLPFWRYHLKWVDVREDYRQQGMSKGLLKLLNESDFLEGHILQNSTFSEMGTQYLENKLNEFLTGKNYCFIPHDYCRTFAPKEFGILDEIGRKLN